MRRSIPTGWVEALAEAAVPPEPADDLAAPAAAVDQALATGDIPATLAVAELSVA